MDFWQFIGTAAFFLLVMPVVGLVCVFIIWKWLDFLVDVGEWISDRVRRY